MVSDWPLIAPYKCYLAFRLETCRGLADIKNMRFLLVTATLLGLLGSATAQEQFGVLTAPDRYMSGQTLAPAHIHMVDGKSLYATCILPQAYACATLSLSTCDIYIWDGYQPKTSYGFYEVLLEHEMAHCRGWPGNHPD